jgi:hypothetical protein
MVQGNADSWENEKASAARQISGVDPMRMDTHVLETMAHTSEEFGEIGFTNEDRKSLITLGVHFEHLFKRLDTYEGRLTQIERDRASKDDLQKLERDLREEHRNFTRDVREEMARVQKSVDKEVNEVKASVATINDEVQKITVRLARWSGVIMVAGALFEIIIRLFWK